MFFFSCFSLNGTVKRSFFNENNHSFFSRVPIFYEHHANECCSSFISRLVAVNQAQVAIIGAIFRVIVTVFGASYDPADLYIQTGERYNAHTQKALSFCRSDYFYAPDVSSERAARRITFINVRFLFAAHCRVHKRRAFCYVRAKFLVASQRAFTIFYDRSRVHYLYLYWGILFFCACPLRNSRVNWQSTKSLGIKCPALSTLPIKAFQLKKLIKLVVTRPKQSIK